MCHIFANSVEAFQKSFGPHAKEIMGDIPNYTDIAPVMQISEVVVEKSITGVAVFGAGILRRSYLMRPPSLAASLFLHVSREVFSGVRIAREPIME